MVKLTWTTESELNDDHFNVERSSDGTTFLDLTSIKGAGTSSTQHQYSFIDQVPVFGRSYYRLVQNDFDGSQTYSEVCMVDDNLSIPNVSIYPNPAANSVTIEYRNVGNVSGVKVMNSIGIVMAISAEISSSFIKLNTTTLTSGLYIIELLSENETAGSYKISYRQVDSETEKESN